MSNSRQVPAPLLPAIAAIAWGAMFPIAHRAFAHVDPFNITAIRYAIATLGFVALLALVEGRNALSFEGRGLELFVFGTLGFAGFNLLAYVGLAHAEPQSAAIIIPMAPLLALLVAWALDGARPSAEMLAVVAVALAGVVLVATKGDPAQLSGGVGELLVLLGVLSFVFYTRGAARFAGWSPLRYTALSAPVGTTSILAATAVADVAGWQTLPSAGDVAGAWWEIAFIVVFGALVGVLAWNAGVARLDPANAAVFMALVPTTAFVIRIAGGYTPGAAEIAGMGLVLVALVGHNVLSRRVTKQAVAQKADLPCHTRPMDQGSVAGPLSEGRTALEAARWDEARAAFAVALAESPDDPDALDGIAQATWFLGDVADGIDARERAFEGYARERCDEAARVAVWVSHQHLVAGRSSAARGWLARAERIVAEIPHCAGHGWVAMERARHAVTIEECIDHAQRAMAIAREHDLADLEVFALSQLGRAEVDAGHRVEGMALLEEAMAAAAAGRMRNVHMLGEAYCNLISAATAAGDWEHATEWCSLVDEFARERGVTPLLGACRTIHADVLVATGRWDDAERALESALESHARFVPAMGAPTVACMAELRVLQGRISDAERLLSGREEHPGSLRALAHLRIAQGEPQIAAGLLERGLLAAQGDAVRTMQLLAPLVDARLACGDHDAAATAAHQLQNLAAATGIALAQARSDLAAARVALHADEAADAAEAARRALEEFGRLAMPLDSGHARLELARAIAAGDPAIAREEAHAAFDAFRALGAARAMDEAAAVLRGLDTATGGRPRVHGDLTAREHEVLELIALGMSNAKIAQTLFIAEKTVGHHVSRILSKLGVHNRTEAAARAARLGVGIE